MDWIELAPTLATCGRLAVGGLFAVAGVEHFFALKPLSTALNGRGVPLPGIALVSGSLFQLIAGLAVAFGLALPWAAFGLIAFTLVASVLMIDFWNKEGDERTPGIQAWQSNLAIIGALLIIAASSSQSAA